MKCQRCDHRADDLTEHAFASGHLLCIVCQRRSLNEFEPQTCAQCVKRVREILTELITSYALLAPTTTEALTLLGDGTMQRMFHRYETASDMPVHPLARPGDDMRPAPPIRDEWVSDPLPVVAALASWEDFWREHFGDPAGGRATLAGVTGYLLARLERAAQFHPAFDEFAADVRRHRAGVHAAVGLADVPVEAKASCFDCGDESRLLRTYRPPLAPVGRGRRGVDAEGLTDDWTCEACGRVYTVAEYLLALRAARDTARGWVPLPVAAQTAGRPYRTVQAWVTRGYVAAACRTVDRALLVWWPHVHDRAFRSTEERTEHAS